MDIDFSFIVRIFPNVAKALPVTLLLTFLPCVIGAFAGFFIALLRIKKIPVLDQVLGILLSFFRSVPVLVMLFLTYFGVPKLLNVIFYRGVRTITSAGLSSLKIALIVITLYATFFISEIIRGALSSVDMKQFEAAHAIGMTRFRTYTRIVIPQALTVALPNYFNYVLGTLKGTSVVFVISVTDIMTAAKLEAEDSYRFVEAYLLVGFLYIIFGMVFSYLFKYLENTAKAKMGIAKN